MPADSRLKFNRLDKGRWVARDENGVTWDLEWQPKTGNVIATSRDPYNAPMSPEFQKFVADNIFKDLTKH